MLITGTTDKIRLKLGSTSTTQLPFTVDYNKYTSNSVNIISNNGISNDTTAVDLIPSPSNGEQHELRYCSIYNSDINSETVIIEFYDGTNARIIFRSVLARGEMLQYQQEKGWETIDSNGNKKTNAIQIFNNTLSTNPMYRPGNVSGANTLGSQVWYYVYLGRAEKSYNSIDIQYRITTQAAGTLTYSQMAIYSPPIKPVDGTAGVIGRRLGVVNTNFATTGVIKTNIPITSSISVGDKLIAVFAQQYGTTQPVIRATGYVDNLANYVQGAAAAAIGSGRPSLVETGPYVSGYATQLLWLYWQGN